MLEAVDPDEKLLADSKILMAQGAGDMGMGAAALITGLFSPYRQIQDYRVYMKMFDPPPDEGGSIKGSGGGTSGKPGSGSSSSPDEEQPPKSNSDADEADVPPVKSDDEQPKAAQPNDLAPFATRIANNVDPGSQAVSKLIREAYPDMEIKTGTEYLTPEGKIFVEIDIETPNFIIEVKTDDLSGIGKKVDKLLNAHVNTEGKPIVVYVTSTASMKQRRG